MPVRSVFPQSRNPLGVRAEHHVFHQVIDEEPEIQDADDAREIVASELQGRLAFENVTFAFRRPDGELDPPALKNIDLTVEPGERIGILGATGAGKSALVNLVPRFYDVNQGAILVDGYDVRQLELTSLRKQIGIVLQDTFLFSTTVMENIRYGRLKASDDEVVAAARLANAEHVICSPFVPLPP